MSVAPSLPDPQRISGFSFSCRISPEGTFTFDAPSAESELLFEATPDELNKLLSSNGLATSPGDESDLMVRPS